MTYNALDRERTLDILAAYGVGPKMPALQKHFWDMAQLVCRAGGNYGEPFRAKRSVTHVGPLSSLMLNVCVDAIVREWLHQTLGKEATCDGLRIVWLKYWGRSTSTMSLLLLVTQ